MKFDYLKVKERIKNWLEENHIKYEEDLNCLHNKQFSQEYEFDSNFANFFIIVIDLDVIRFNTSQFFYDLKTDLIQPDWKFFHNAKTNIDLTDILTEHQKSMVYYFTNEIEETPAVIIDDIYFVKDKAISKSVTEYFTSKDNLIRTLIERKELFLKKGKNTPSLKRLKERYEKDLIYLRKELDELPL